VRLFPHTAPTSGVVDGEAGNIDGFSVCGPAPVTRQPDAVFRERALLARIPLGPPLAPSNSSAGWPASFLSAGGCMPPVSTPLNWSEVKPTLVPSAVQHRQFRKGDSSRPVHGTIFFENRQPLKGRHAVNLNCCNFIFLSETSLSVRKKAASPGLRAAFGLAPPESYAAFHFKFSFGGAAFGRVSSSTPFARLRGNLIWIDGGLARSIRRESSVADTSLYSKTR